MKNSKKMILGIIIGFLSLSLSSAKNKKVSTINKTSKTKLIIENYLVQRVNGQITPLSNEINSSYCFGTATLYCVYEITQEGKLNIPNLASLGQTYYTPAQISNYSNKWPMPWLKAPLASQKAIYVPY